MGRRSTRELVAMLTRREQTVLSLMAQGRSNTAMAQELRVNDKTIESHFSSIFTRLGLLPQPDAHRRVLAVLAWLGQQAAPPQPGVG